jgi:hypothetical protein
VGERAAARMFAHNIQVWKERSYIQIHHSTEEIEALEAELKGLADVAGRDVECVWGMRQMVFERSGEKGMGR